MAFLVRWTDADGDQAEAVESLIKDSAWSLCEIRPDLQGIPRIVVLQKTGANSCNNPDSRGVYGSEPQKGEET